MPVHGALVGAAIASVLMRIAPALVSLTLSATLIQPRSPNLLVRCWRQNCPRRFAYVFIYSTLFVQVVRESGCRQRRRCSPISLAMPAAKRLMRLMVLDG